MKDLEKYVNEMLNGIADYTKQSRFDVMYEYLQLVDTTNDLYYMEANFVKPDEQTVKNIYLTCVEVIFDKYVGGK